MRVLEPPSPFELDSNAFVGNVKKARGRKNAMRAAALRSLRDGHARTIEPGQCLAAEFPTFYHRLSDLINAADGATPDGVALMRATSPPRMPI